MNTSSVAFATLVVLLSLAGTARGDILVDHQPHPYGGLGSDTLFTAPSGRPVWQLVADDFTLAAPDQAVSVNFWGFYNEDNPPAVETMRIRIEAARLSDGLPDDNNILSESTVQNPSRMATGRFVLADVGAHEYIYTASLSAPVSLGAGTTYWLEVAQIGDITTDFRWEDSVADFNGVAAVNSIHADWQDTFPAVSADAAFRLISPEPASSVMLALGLPSLAWRRRSRKGAST